MEDEKRYCVYMHVFPNDKKYIGITCQNIKYRWRHDGTGYKPRKNKNSSKVWNAICKYGWENVEHKILYEDLSREEACKKERELIAYYKTIDDNYRYNIALGGDVNAVSESTKRKISESKKGKNYGIFGEKAPMYGKHHTKETKEKISIAMSGKNNPMYGKYHTEDTKKMCIISHLFESKIIVQYDKNGNLSDIYLSIREASRKTGINRSCITASLNGKQQTAGKCIWRCIDLNNFSIFNRFDLNFMNY